MNHDVPNSTSPRWLHALALLTVVLTLPLLFLGAGVTSHGVGMVDPQGFRAPWVIVNAFFEDCGFAMRLEYGHRIFGFLVGVCGIALALGCWFCDSRPWLRWFALGALMLICMQGLLGIFRVDFNALYGRTFSMIHGIFAQIVFASLVSVAVFTSRRWARIPDEPPSPAVQRWSIIAMLIVFVQLILGGLVRHQESLLGPRGHLLGAFAVLGVTIWLLKVMRDNESSSPLPVGEGPGVRAESPTFAFERIAIMILLTLQLGLGVESWLAKFHVERANLPQLAPAPMHAEWIRTAHYLVGTLIFATTVMVALVAHRKALAVVETMPMRDSKLEGAL